MPINKVKGQELKVESNDVNRFNTTFKYRIEMLKAIRMKNHLLQTRYFQLLVLN